MNNIRWKAKQIAAVVLMALFFIPQVAHAQLDLVSGSVSSAIGSGAGTGRGLGFQAQSNYQLTSVGIFAGLNNEAHQVTLYSSTDGNQTTGVLASASLTLGGLGDQFYDININYSLVAGQYYVVSWAPVDGQTGWVSGNYDYFLDTNLPFTVAPILMINGTEGFDASHFSNGWHPHLRFNGAESEQESVPVPVLTTTGLGILMLLLIGLGWLFIRRS